MVGAVIALADDHLILGHRLSEWCGHAPMLEEDLALPNIALDLIGVARVLYTYAGELEGKGRDEDALAYLRLERDYRNALLCERPNGDFAHTMLRQLFFSQLMLLYWQAMPSSDATLHAIAAKAVKESRYHLRHSAEWVIRLGDGTETSALKLRDALVDLWPYVPELVDGEAGHPGADTPLPDRAALKTPFLDALRPIFGQALLEMPDWPMALSGGRRGIHTEDMGPLLADLQYVQRAYPGLTW